MRHPMNQTATVVSQRLQTGIKVVSGKTGVAHPTERQAQQTKDAVKAAIFKHVSGAQQEKRDK